MLKSPDEEGVPLLVNDDVGGTHERLAHLRVLQDVLSQAYSVLPVTVT